MKTKDRLIVLLAIFGVILFGVVHFVIIPENKEKAAEYAAAQLSPVTHDIESIQKYKSKYMGDASNLINLFRSLPLCNYENTYQLHSDKLELEINYKVSTKTIGEQKTIEAIYYDGTAAFALIDNLQQIRFNFDDQQFTVPRDFIEVWFDEKNLSNLIDKKVWEKSVQDKLTDSAYISKWFLALTTHGRTRLN